MNWFERRTVALALAWATLGLPHGPVQAHPHGVMACSLAVHFENGQPALLAARLLMDEAHSAQALEGVRDPQTGQPEAARLQRMLFLLKTQMARAGWLLSAESGGTPADLEAAAEPRIVVTEQGRMGVDVALRLQTGAKEPALPPDAPWTFACRDPSLYWTTELAVDSGPGAATGCAKPRWSPVQKRLTGALAGSAQVQLQCEK